MSARTTACERCRNECLDYAVRMGQRVCIACVGGELDAALRRERVLLHAAWVLEHGDECGPVSPVGILWGCSGCERRHRAKAWLRQTTERPEERHEPH